MNSDISLATKSGHFYLLTTLRKLPEGQQRDVLRTLTQEEKADLLAKLKCASSDLGTDSTVTVQENLSRVENVPEGYILDAPKSPKGDDFACIAEPIDPPISKVKKGGIQTVNWSRKLSVESIETEDGQILYPTPEPSAWTYLLIATFPMLGFFIPWGVIRAIGWVGAGYVQPSK